MNVNAVKAFLKAQSEMGSAIKNSVNPFLKNKYADLKALQEAVYPVFHANGFAILQCGGADQYGQFIDTMMLHESGEIFSSKIYLDYKNGDMQSKGGSVTYARRYGLQSLSGIPVEDDDGNHAVGHDMMAVKQASKERKLSLTQQELLERAVRMERAAKSSDAEFIIKFTTEAYRLIELIKAFDPDRASQLKNAWESREKELAK
jgi:hypothetical protein